MTSRGWHLDRLQFPESLHMTITHSNIAQAEPFIEDLQASVRKVRKSRFRKVTSSVMISMAQGFAKTLPGGLFQKITR
ncbi:unnamed protein product, partial [marine sediment metagenome]